MNFIILADKYQKGMKSKGCVGMLNVDSKYNVFDHQYRYIKKKYKRAKIIYVCGFEYKKISNYVRQKAYKDVVLIYNENYEKYNHVYSLSLAKDYMNKNFFVLPGDLYFKSSLFDNFETSKGTQILINQKQKSSIGCNIDDNNNISYICFDLQNFIMDIYFVHKKNVEEFKYLTTLDKNKNCFLFEIMNKMIDKNIEIKPLVYNKSHITKRKTKESKVTI